ncbi:GNAT family N-acetyltransferase [Sciscionella sediminilitoris]|uniref:GNAT family N-acetyltransferase n=1 Tax=Sciscionella sediminilitoris TaxID=1445613 RepID=UPI0004DF3DB6|nr:GNAT family N-acetyltransferase [Sciscionella sp. SE31]
MTEVRAATPADAEGIAKAQIRAWQHAYTGLMPEEFLRTLSVLDRASDLRAKLTRTGGVRTLVAVEKGTVLGFASHGPDRGEAGIGELYALYLDPDHWRRGIGTLLHTAALRELLEAGHREAVVWMLDGNERARRFYEAHGWRADGARKQESIRGSPPLEEIRLHRLLV